LLCGYPFRQKFENLNASERKKDRFDGKDGNVRGGRKLKINLTKVGRIWGKTKMLCRREGEMQKKKKGKP
jgi:hypothetical protein